MKAAVLPSNEKERLEALRAYEMLDTFPERSFDDLTVMASHICDVPIALISLVAENRQWFKSKLGLSAESTTREVSFCAHAILLDDVLMIPDSHLDDRFHDNPLVLGEPRIRFYAGAPLTTPSGLNVGTLCVIDRKPKALNDAQKRALASLAHQVVSQMELRAKIRDLVRANERAMAAEEGARAASRSKSLFLANMSHEIRTPMNGIIGMTDLLLETKVDAVQREHLTVIQHCGSTLVKVINDVLDFSKIEAGHVEIESLSFEPARALSETMSLFRPLFEKKGLALETRIAPTLPRIIHGDEHRVRQILSNILNNALKFTAHGSVKVAAEATDLPGGFTDIHVSVKDTGIGITKESQTKLFNPFAQGDETTSRRFGGTGLGLAISKNYCEMMGGAMWLESVPNEGSTFHFSFRVKAAEASAALPEPKRSTAQPLATENLSILVAEDNLVNQKVILGFLKKLGYSADVAENGLEALDQLARKKYALIFMDCQMPELDGYETTERIIAANASDRPYIVALTASARAEDKARCLEVGMDAFLTKPFKMADLQTALAEFAERRGSVPPGAKRVA